PWSAAADEAPQEEEQVRRPLGQTPHEVAVPVRPVRRGDEDVVAAGNEVELQARPDAVEHLELEAVVRDAPLAREGDRALDQRLVVRGDRGEASSLERRLDEARVRGVDVALLRVGDLRRLQVRALDD